MTQEISSASDWLAIAYLVVHAGYSLLGCQRPKRVVLVVAVDALLILLFLEIAARTDHSLLGVGRWQRIVVLWAPVVFFWWAYKWASRTFRAIYPEDVTFDRWLIRWEERWFGQPTLWLARQGSPWKTDVLHLFYNTYYFYTPFLGIYLQTKGRLQDFQEMMLAVLVGYAVGYSLFVIVPTWGPRWGLVQAGLLRPEEQRLEGYAITRVTNIVMYEGLAHRGGAMPSCHTSTALVFLVWCWRIWGPLGGVPALVVVAGMVVGAVYGRYHYVLDILAGLALGALGLLVAQFVF